MAEEHQDTYEVSLPPGIIHDNHVSLLIPGNPQLILQKPKVSLNLLIKHVHEIGNFGYCQDGTYT